MALSKEVEYVIIVLEIQYRLACVIHVMRIRTAMKEETHDSFPMIGCGDEERRMSVLKCGLNVRAVVNEVGRDCRVALVAGNVERGRATPK